MFSRAMSSSDKEGHEETMRRVEALGSGEGNSALNADDIMFAAKVRANSAVDSLSLLSNPSSSVVAVLRGHL